MPLRGGSKADVMYWKVRGEEKAGGAYTAPLLSSQLNLRYPFCGVLCHFKQLNNRLTHPTVDLCEPLGEGVRAGEPETQQIYNVQGRDQAVDGGGGHIWSHVFGTHVE